MINMLNNTEIRVLNEIIATCEKAKNNKDNININHIESILGINTALHGILGV